MSYQTFIRNENPYHKDKNKIYNFTNHLIYLNFAGPWNHSYFAYFVYTYRWSRRTKKYAGIFFKVFDNIGDDTT